MRQLAHDAARARVVGRRVRRTNNTMFLGTVACTATNDWRRRRAAMQEAGSDEGRWTCDARRQKVRLQVSF